MDGQFDERRAHDDGQERGRGLVPALNRVLWTVIAVLGGLSVVALLGTVVVDVLLRFLQGSSIMGANDMVASWWMVSIAFFGIALAQRFDGRIQVDFLVDALPPAMRRVVDVLVLLVVAAIGAVLCWGGLLEALEQMEAGEYAAVGHRPIWPARFVVPLGFAAFTLACIQSIVQLLARPPAPVSRDVLPDRIQP